jgi:hypothetical protein
MCVCVRVRVCARVWVYVLIDLPNMCVIFVSVSLGVNV